MGRFDEAFSAAEKGRKADPLGLLANFGPGSVLVFQHPWGDAIHSLQGAIDLDPDYWFDYCFQARPLEAKAQCREPLPPSSMVLCWKIAQSSGRGWGMLMQASGKRDEARKVLAHLQLVCAHRYVPPYNVAVIYAGVGDQNAAFMWLDRAFHERSYLLAVYLNTDSRLDTFAVIPVSMNLEEGSGYRRSEEDSRIGNTCRRSWIYLRP